MASSQILPHDSANPLCLTVTPTRPSEGPGETESGRKKSARRGTFGTAVTNQLCLHVRLRLRRALFSDTMARTKTHFHSLTLFSLCVLVCGVFVAGAIACLYGEWVNGCVRAVCDGKEEKLRERRGEDGSGRGVRVVRRKEPNSNRSINQGVCGACAGAMKYESAKVREDGVTTKVMCGSELVVVAVAGT